MRRLWAIILCLAAATAARGDEAVVGALSQNQISITADFDGSSIFVFGAVKRDAPIPEGATPLEVVIVVSGPNERLTVRRKARHFGVWTNSALVEVDQAPSFYIIAGSGPLEEVMSATERLRYRIGYEEAVRIVGETGRVADPQAFAEAVVRIRERSGTYARLDDVVGVRQETLFATDIALPPNIVEGDYTARMFLLRDRKVINVAEETIYVRKVGLERIIYNSSRQQPLAYGLAAIFVALAAGLGASEAFRLLRR